MVLHTCCYTQRYTSAHLEAAERQPIIAHTRCCIHMLHEDSACHLDTYSSFMVLLAEALASCSPSGG